MEAEQYKNQVRLILKLLPLVMAEEEFALKGGTAINFFWREYPRLSVDIDLTYLPLDDRSKSLHDIDEKLHSILQRIRLLYPQVTFQKRNDKESSLINGLLLTINGVSLKIEVNTVIRGSVLPPIIKDICKRAESEFEVTCSVRTLSFEDLFAGKICAALDRQHPRDLFDIKLLLENEGLSDQLRKVFLVYLISSPRPIAELLNPNHVQISQIWSNELAGMTRVEISLEDLYKTRKQLVDLVNRSLTEDEKKFLISFKELNPDWKLLGLDGIENLPALRWKLFNLSKMEKKSHTIAVQKLKDILTKNNIS